MRPALEQIFVSNAKITARMLISIAFAVVVLARANPATAGISNNIVLNIVRCADQSNSITVASSTRATTIYSGHNNPIREVRRIDRGPLTTLFLRLPLGHTFLNIRQGKCAGQVGVMLFPGETRELEATLESSFTRSLDLWEGTFAGTLPVSGIWLVQLVAPNGTVMNTAKVEGRHFYFEFVKPMHYVLRITLRQDETYWRDVPIDLTDLKLEPRLLDVSVKMIGH